MDKTFKAHIEPYGLSKSVNFENHWILQIERMDSYWDRLIDCIDKNQFRTFLLKEAEELNIADAEKYDLDTAFSKAKSEWRLELMINCANLIAAYHLYIEVQPLVKWTGSKLEIQWNEMKYGN